MKKWLKYLVYISVLFLAWSLWKADYLHIPKIENISALVFSIIFLFGGYFTKSKVWQMGLRAKSINVNVLDGIASTGLAELGKYIPGKLWVILGRAGYISGRYDITTGKASGISLVVQFITIWSGIFFALTGIIFIQVPLLWIIALAAGWIVLTFILFFKPFHNSLQGLYKKFFKKEIRLPFINLKEIKPVLHWFFFDWIIRMIGFYFMLAALTTQSLSPALAAGFPLSIALGIIVVIAPGGIGIREGVLVVWLKTAGFDAGTATTLAIATRLWTLLGEIGIFVIGLIFKERKK